MAGEGEQSFVWPDTWSDGPRAYAPPCGPSTLAAYISTSTSIS